MVMALQRTATTTIHMSNPGLTEIPYNDIDDDCDPLTLDDDLDMDGFGIEEDCDDSEPRYKS